MVCGLSLLEPVEESRSVTHCAFWWQSPSQPLLFGVWLCPTALSPSPHFFSSLFAVLGIEPRALSLQGKRLPLELLYFVFETKSH
jgi:hypothetical protein